ncbi:MAG: AraC family transcriptional regulator [Actinomycetota bacterium]
MRARSERGPVLAGVEVLSAGAAADRFDQQHHHLVWSPTAALQVRTPREAAVIGAPLGLWVPAEHPYDVDSSSTWWAARFESASCPASWRRFSHVSVGEVIGPMLVHLHRVPQSSHALALAGAVAEQLSLSFTTQPLPVRFPTDPRAREVADAVVSDPASRRELADWAPLVGASERTLRRLFVQQTGLPFRRWRLRVRAQTATRLLRDGLTVGEVAGRCGYGSADALSHAFRVEFGLAPSQLAELHLERGFEGGWPLASGPCPPGSDDRGDDLRDAVHDVLTGDRMLRVHRPTTLALCAVALLLAACADSDQVDGAASPSDSDSATAETTTTSDTATEAAAPETTAPEVAAAPGDATTRVITDMVGREVEIPVAPQRIAALQDLWLGIPLVATLGYDPLGIAGSQELAATAAAFTEGEVDFDGIEYLGLDWEINIEAVAAAEPDLILIVDWQQDLNLEGLSQVAPTLVISTMMDDGPLAHEAFLAELVGAEEQFAAQVADYDARVTEVRDAHGEEISDLSYTFMSFYPGDAPYIYATEGPAFDWNAGTAVLTDLGLEPSATVDGVVAPEDAFRALSFEEAPDYDADLVFLSLAGTNDVDDGLATVMSNMSAARNDQIVQVRDEVWNFPGIGRQTSILENLAELFETRELVDGPN